MDYVFAPGRTNYDRLVRNLFKNRANTELIVTQQSSPGSPTRTRVRRIDQLITCLSQDTDITRPIDLFYIGTHGNDNGMMQVPFADIDIDGSRGLDMTTYETLQEAQNRNIGQIPANTLSQEAKLRIRGCNIGQDYALPFIQELTFTFGGQPQISAPKHFHYVKSLPNAGMLEAFCYQFEISVLERFRGNTARADLINAFQNESFDFRRPLQNTLSDDWWEKWVPRWVGRGTRAVTHRVRLNPPILPRVGQPINSQRLTIDSGFRAELRTYTWTVSDVDTAPGSDAAGILVVKDSIRKSDSFKNDHAYPIHKRYEFDTVEEFLDGHTWTVAYNRRGKKLIGTGKRYVYTCIVPITDNPDPDAGSSDPNKNKLIYNFYPASNNPNPAIELIDETDAEIFQIH